jgi:hypothetical protein
MQASITTATKELIRLSNSIHDVNTDFNNITREKIAKLLNLRVLQKSQKAVILRP